MFDDIVIIRGGGDLATGIIQKIYRSGFKILILEIDKPTVIRRTVSFARAIFDGQAIVEGVKVVKVNNTNEIFEIWNQGHVPVMADKECGILNEIKPDILVDAILAKKNLGTHKGMAPITIGVGPGFTAGEDVDVVIETKRGHDLGKLIFSGTAIQDTGVPGEILGYGKERLIKSPCAGKISNLCDIGELVKKDQILAHVDNEPVIAQIDGVLRGIIENNSEVKKGLKIGDIDPRGIKEHCFTVSDKARSIGGGVLEAILYLKKLKMEDQ